MSLLLKERTTKLNTCITNQNQIYHNDNSFKYENLEDIQRARTNKYGTEELQIRGGTEDNSKIIFLMSQQKHML